MKAPFPYFGGKSKVAPLVWQRFGDTPNYVEPFFGSGAVLLNRPFPVRVETVNDKDPYVSNFFRALQAAPEEVAYYCDYPVIETDLHARHLWLVNQGDFRERMLADPEYYDAKIAGWWVWGLSAWIGSGWCKIESYEANKNTRPQLSNRYQGVHRTAQQIPRVRDAGRGVHRDHQPSQPRPNLRPHQGVQSVPNKRPNLVRGNGGRGVHRARPGHQLPHLQGDSGATGQGVNAGYVRGDLYAYMDALAARLRRVRVCCGDWSRIMGKSVTYLIGITGVFLDPPYSDDERQEGIYSKDSMTVAHEVREWCLESGDNPKLRIALCGYVGEHDELEAAGWDVAAWKANGGYGGQRKDGSNNNSGRERVWFSPHCLNPLGDIFTGKRGHEVDINDPEKMPLFNLRR